jgi:glycosyltransferase involved in cell wall biosynthesis
LVTVISVFHDRAPSAETSIRSLLAQTYEQLEVLLVDDGSTDGTTEILQSFQGGRVRVEAHERKGFTQALVDAIALARGELIAVHGAGDVSLPTRIEKLAALMKSDPGLGFVASWSLTESNLDGGARLHKPAITGPLPDTLLRYNVFLHGEMMFRRSEYDRAGGYRTLFKLGQDYDLWLRMSETTRAALVPEVLYMRSIVPGSVSVDAIRTSHQVRYTHFARACARERRATGADAIMRGHGEAAFAAFRSREAAHELASLGAQWCLARGPEQGLPLLRASLSEVPTRAGLLRLALFSTHAVPPLYALLRPWLRRWIQGR